MHADGPQWIDDIAGFLGDGVTRRLRVGFAGSGTPDELWGQLQGWEDADRLAADGSLVVLAADGEGGPRLAGDQVIARYDALTSQALTDGYQGFRVFADARGLIDSQADLDAFADHEMKLDTYMCHRPFSAACAFDDSLDEDTLGVLACVHPLKAPSLTPVVLHVGVEPGGQVAVAGEVDISVHHLLDCVLSHLHPPAGGATLVVDMAGLTFIDYRGMARLDQWAAGWPGPVALRNVPASARAMLELLPLSSLTVAAGE